MFAAVSGGAENGGQIEVAVPIQVRGHSDANLIVVRLRIRWWEWRHAHVALHSAMPVRWNSGVPSRPTWGGCALAGAG